MKSSMVTALLEKFEDALDEAKIVLPNSEKEDNPDTSNLYGTQYGDLYEYINAMVLEKMGNTLIPIAEESCRVSVEVLTKQELLEWLSEMCSKLEHSVVEWENPQFVYDIYAALCEIIPDDAKTKFIMGVNMDLRGEIRKEIHLLIVRKLNDFIVGIRNYINKDYFHIAFLKAYVRCMGEAIMEEIVEKACEREEKQNES